MSTTTAAFPVTMRRVVAAELIKLRTLRSNVWLLAVATAAVVILGPVQAIGARMSGESAADLSTAFTGVTTAMLLLGVLGVLTVAGEYSPRAIRTTFTLVPRRGHVVLGRTLALSAVTTVAGAAAVAAALIATLVVLPGTGWSWQPTAAMVWYLTGWAVLGQAAGWLTRSKIGGSALLMFVMLLLAPTLSLVPGRAGEVLVALTPSAAGSAMIGGEHAATGFLLWTAYLVGCTALSAWAVSRRDA